MILVKKGIHMFEKLKEILVNEMDVDESKITPDADLVNDLGINSLDLADLVQLCEDNFNVTIKDEDMTGLITVKDICDYLEKNAK